MSQLLLKTHPHNPFSLQQCAPCGQRRALPSARPPDTHRCHQAPATRVQQQGNRRGNHHAFDRPALPGFPETHRHRYNPPPPAPARVPADLDFHTIASVSPPAIAAAVLAPAAMAKPSQKLPAPRPASSSKGASHQCIDPRPAVATSPQQPAFSRNVIAAAMITPFAVSPLPDF